VVEVRRRPKRDLEDLCRGKRWILTCRDAVLSSSSKKKETTSKWKNRKGFDHSRRILQYRTLYGVDGLGARDDFPDENGGREMFKTKVAEETASTCVQSRSLRKNFDFRGGGERMWGRGGRGFGFLSTGKKKHGRQ